MDLAGRLLVDPILLEAEGRRLAEDENRLVRRTAEVVSMQAEAADQEHGDTATTGSRDSESDAAGTASAESDLWRIINGNHILRDSDDLWHIINGNHSWQDIVATVAKARWRTPDNQAVLVTVAEAADRLKCPEKTIRNWIAKGGKDHQLKAVDRLGGPRKSAARYRLDDISKRKPKR